MVEVLEEGDVYFLYRPRVVGADEEAHPEGVEDIQRFFMVLSPHGKRLYRLVVLGRKRLPAVKRGGEKYWAFVDRVEHDPKALREDLEGGEYATRTRGEREVPPARAAGEGVYGIVRHDGHAHFVYVLELPKQPREVQDELNISDEASYVISVKNPSKPSPRRTGLRPSQKAALPKSLMSRFRNRRFADPAPELLDYAGTEFVLIGAGEDVKKELGTRFGAEDESAGSAEIFTDLRLRKSRNPVKPLFEGRWE
ncbi:MAG: hypothetical protein AB7U81_04475 [Thiohalomonadaceae bacterium]